MTSGTRAAVVGFALSNLYLLCLTGPLVSPQHELVFHLPGSATLFFLPAIFDILLLFASLTAALLCTRRHSRADLFLWSALLFSLPAALMATAFGFSGRTVPPWLGWSVALVAVAAFLAVNLRPKVVLPRFAQVQGRAALLLSFLALPQLLLVVQLFWYAWQARKLNPPFVPASHPLITRGENPPIRVVWIILDELSFDQLYGHRFPGLALPNFDRLAAQSSVFTQAQPTAEYTRLAIPSMLTGRPLRLAQPTADGRTLTLYTAHSDQKLPLVPTDTVFGDAQRVGLPTAVAGWYEPYCRLLPGVLNRCFWTYSDEPPPGMRVNASLLQNTLGPFLHFLHLPLSSAKSETPDTLDVQRHKADYDHLLAASDDLLLSGQTGLILLHMPIPHPWGFYDRHNQSFPNHRTSYLDNLALADAYIGRVREELERKGVWNDTALLIMGDHSWRTASVWARSEHWTAEEQAASHRQAYDSRPAVVLKLPGQKDPAVISARYDAVRTRSLIDQLLSQILRTPGDLQGWVAGSAASSPPSAVPVSPSLPAPAR